MGLVTPLMLTVNLNRINELSERFSDSTIAKVINDERGTDLTATDVKGYRKVSNIASKVMLVSKPSMKALTSEPSQTPATKTSK